MIIHLHPFHPLIITDVLTHYAFCVRNALCIVFLAAVFVTLWKRREAKIGFTWDLDTQETIEQNRPEYEVTHFGYLVSYDERKEKYFKEKTFY